MKGGLKYEGLEKTMPVRERTKSAPTLLMLDNIDLPSNGARSSFSRDSISNESEIIQAFGAFGSIDVTGQSFDFGAGSSTPRRSSARQSSVSANW